MKDVVKLKQYRSGSGGLTTSLGVPKEIADAVTSAGLDAFRVELTEDGILYRPMTGPVEEIVKPSWLATPPRPAARGRRAAEPAGVGG